MSLGLNSLFLKITAYALLIFLNLLEYSKSEYYGIKSIEEV